MKTIKNVVSLLLFLITPTLMAGESIVPLQKGLRVASDDLVFKGKVLTTREADALSKQGLDLSTLAPKANDIWGDSEVSNINDQEAVAINEGDILSYEGSLLSNSGLFRFNAIPTNGNKIYTIHLDKTLHTMLLRKNLLRALGYKIPAMKYLKKVTIQFNSKIEMDTFLKREIPEATLGAPERWAQVNLIKADQLTLNLKDVAITEPSENDFYNVSMGIPTQTINSRSLRSLLIPYSLVDLYESVNKFSWVVGKVDNRAVVLGHFTANEFSTALEDAIWMVKRVNKLTRDDIKKMVANAYFPKDIEALLVEKIISRRNSLNKVFDTKAVEISFNSKITVGTVVEGKAALKEYPEYASRFAHEDAESPLDKLMYFINSKVQSNIIDNAIAQFNKNLVFFDLKDARSEYYKKQFKEGLEHFIKTGELIPIGVGVWFSPDISASLLFSRDIILGNYLGTDNLVQLADTFGASADIGLFMGIEGLGYNLSSSVKVSTALVRSYTHLKPVKNLRESLKEPYRNIFVSMIKNSLKDKFFSLAELEEAGKAENVDDEKSKAIKEEQRKKVEAVLAEIDKKLGVGETLIMTDRLMPSAAVRLNFSEGLVGAGVGLSGGVTILKRIHFYKKSAKVLQIYNDSGFVRNIDLSFQVSSYITLLKLNAKFDKGNYGVNSYMINLSADTKENPDLFKNALAVYNVLKNKNFELLDKSTEPVQVDVKFQDKSFGASFLFWRAKHLTTKTYFDITAKNGVRGSYFSLNKDYMIGINPESFSKKMANYYLSQEFEDVEINEEANRNPGESFFGRSSTQSLRFEASYNDKKEFDQKFLSLSDVKQGWSMSEKKIKKFMNSVNLKFGNNLYDASQIDFKKIRLYRIGYHMNLYNRGIDRLNSIAITEIEAIEKVYKKERKCSINSHDKNNARCGDLRNIIHRIKKCPKSKDQEKLANCTAELFEQLMDDLDFDDFRKLLGEENIYVYGSIDGFREKSEILNNTIYSNTIGKISSKQWNGPLASVRDLLGLSDGEFAGKWLRDTI
jgi:hypothetical protein